MSTFATVVGLAAAVCTTGANLPQLKKAWSTGQTDDISMNMLLVLASGLALWVAYGVLQKDIVIIVANAISLLLIGGLVSLKCSSTKCAGQGARPKTLSNTWDSLPYKKRPPKRAPPVV
jgi:MtN3 and saliva related transmembrane protein